MKKTSSVFVFLIFTFIIFSNAFYAQEEEKDAIPTASKFKEPI